MTTSNRWYQLSVLQLMVAMAIVALFVLNNKSIKPAAPDATSQPFRYTIYLDDTPLAVGWLQAGWPFPYWHAPGTTSKGHVYLADYPTYQLLPLASNVIICATTIVLSTLSVSRLTRKIRPYHGNT